MTALTPLDRLVLMTGPVDAAAVHRATEFQLPSLYVLVHLTWFLRAAFVPLNPLFLAVVAVAAPVAVADPEGPVGVLEGARR